MTGEGGILVLNSGSSSIKFALFHAGKDGPHRVWRGVLERIGFEVARFLVRDSHGAVVVDDGRNIPDHAMALDLLLAWLSGVTAQGMLVAVGHRVVHGGEDCDCPLVVTSELEARLKELIPLAPLHLPHNLAGIEAIHRQRPDLLQVACFDTAFHHGLPRVARMTGLPRRFEREGIRRYGFHGLSYEYIIDEIRRRDGAAAADARIIVAHLGNGASMAAIEQGRSVETTMGFSTLAGVPMGTRPGDLDPGIVLYLLLERQMSAEDLQDVLFHDSGLLGMSGISRNMADLLAKPDMPEAAEAVDYFCHHARRHLAGLTASLGGLDRLVFTGGIGANSSEIRSRICNGLSYLGLETDAGRNAAGERVISTDASLVFVEAFKTDEELMIARHVENLLETDSAGQRIEAHG